MHAKSHIVNVVRLHVLPHVANIMNKYALILPFTMVLKTGYHVDVYSRNITFFFKIGEPAIRKFYLEAISSPVC